MPLPPADPHSFKQAVDYFRKKIPITDDEYDQLDKELHEQAFTIANITQADVVKSVYDAIDSAINNGLSFEDFKGAVTDTLTAEWGSENPSRVETIFRTNVLSSYNAGRYDIMSDPDTQQDRPYWRFDAIMDDRTSDICSDLHDTIKPVDDSFWDSHHPPLHHQCRSILTPLTQSEAEDAGVTTHTPKVDAADGFGNPPSAFEPDPDDYPEEIRSTLKDRLS